MESRSSILLTGGFSGGPDNLLSGWPKATGGRPENARSQFVNKRVTSCALEMSSRAFGHQLAQTTQPANSEVIVLGEEN
jgi:hypothetical protein